MKIYVVIAIEYDTLKMNREIKRVPILMNPTSRISPSDWKAILLTDVESFFPSLVFQGQTSYYISQNMLFQCNPYFLEARTYVLVITEHWSRTFENVWIINFYFYIFLMHIINIRSITLFGGRFNGAFVLSPILIDLAH